MYKKEKKTNIVKCFCFSCEMSLRFVSENCKAPNNDDKNYQQTFNAFLY